MFKIRKGDLLEGVQITDAASEGMAIARVEGFVIFIELGVPGDIADIQIYRNRKNFAEAKIVTLHQPSPFRIQPVCGHFGICGGCKWQQMRYDQQLVYKQQQVEDVLTRIGKVPLPPIATILGSSRTEYYRNRLDFTFSDSRWLTTEEKSAGISPAENVIGFHIPQRFDKVLGIHTCYLQEDLSNKIRNEVKRFANANNFTFNNVYRQEGWLRNLTIRSTSIGEWMVILVFRNENTEHREQLMNHIGTMFPEIKSLQYIINPKKNDTTFDLDVHLFKGTDYITEEMEGLRFKISAKSFYQTNSLQAYELYKTARSFAELQGSELVYDLYTGTGTIACFVSKSARHVTGIDYVADAIQDAKENAAANNILNTSFHAGDIKETLTDQFIRDNGKPEVIITDPPRAGMHEEVVKKMLEIEPAKIVYVSCNPSTQARDIHLLSEKYSIQKLQPVDMFPHTTHVENVALLIRK